jgi:hypothetical protein
MVQNKLTEDQLFKEFEQWVNDFQTHHPLWEESTRNQYITDAKRILFKKNDCLPGGGYPAVWNHIIRLVPEAKSQFGGRVKSRFRKKKSDCLSQ